MRHLQVLVVLVVGWRIHRGNASTKRGSSTTTSAKVPPLPPWQQDPRANSKDGSEDATYLDMPPTVFSPSGRLVSLENAVHKLNDPSNPSSSLVVAIHCHQGVAIVASLPHSPYLYDPRIVSSASNGTTGALEDGISVTAANTNSNSSTKDVEGHAPPRWSLVVPFLRSAPRGTEPNVMHNKRLSALLPATTTDENQRPPPLPFCVLGTNLVGVVAGAAPDGIVLRHRLQRMARDLREGGGGGGDMSGFPQSRTARAMARRLADSFHLRTLRETNNHNGDDNGNSYRILASGAIVCDRGHELWRIDPSGQFYRCRAAVAGRAAPKAETVLVEILLARATKRKAADDVSTETREDSTVDFDGRQVRQDLYDLTLHEALAIAAETIRTTLQQRSALVATRTTGGGGADSGEATVRLLGLTLPSVDPASSTHTAAAATTAEWHDDDRLAKIVQNIREVEL